jgi:hypothetical protein
LAAQLDGEKIMLSAADVIGALILCGIALFAIVLWFAL